jgi:hypothetical protein
MDEANEKKIVIYSVSDIRAHELIGCYFKQKPHDTFNFHARDDKLKARDVKPDNKSFSFRFDDHPDILWTLSLSPDSGQILRGNWSDSRDPSLEDGTYQAQAGGGAEEEPNAASACA